MLVHLFTHLFLRPFFAFCLTWSYWRKTPKIPIQEKICRMSPVIVYFVQWPRNQFCTFIFVFFSHKKNQRLLFPPSLNMLFRYNKHNYCLGVHMMQRQYYFLVTCFIYIMFTSSLFLGAKTCLSIQTALLHSMSRISSRQFPAPVVVYDLLIWLQHCPSPWRAMQIQLEKSDIYARHSMSFKTTLLITLHFISRSIKILFILYWSKKGTEQKKTLSIATKN